METAFHKRIKFAEYAKRAWSYTPHFSRCTAIFHTGATVGVVDKRSIKKLAPTLSAFHFTWGGHTALTIDQAAQTITMAGAEDSRLWEHITRCPSKPFQLRIKRRKTK